MAPKRNLLPIEEMSLRLTSWIGTPTSIIIHTLIFIGIFGLYFFGVDFGSILLVLTTAVSLEAIYLAIFIQMSINRNTESLLAVEEDVEEIAKDVDEIQEDVDEIQEDVQSIEDDVEEIAKDVDEIQEDVTEDEESENKELIEKVQNQLNLIMEELQALKKKHKE